MRKKSQATDWEKRLAKHIPDKRLYPEYKKYCYYSVRQSIKMNRRFEQTSPSKIYKWATIT